MSTIKVNAIQNTSGVEVYTAKAWVNFNGTGTVAIRASGNVSSITDNGVGDYTVNFTSAMIDANFASVVTGGGTGAIITKSPGDASTQNATWSRVVTASAGQVLTDYAFVNVAIFR